MNTLYRLVCRVKGHRRYPSHGIYRLGYATMERCARCDTLAPYDSVFRKGWERQRHA